MMKHPVHILLVDDDSYIRTMYADYLGKHGFDVTTEGSATSALGHLLNGEKFDLVITDIMMAKMDGWEFLKTIRKGLRLDDATLPVIVISAFESDTLEAKALGEGANGSFIKGGSPLEDLLRQVRIQTGQERCGYSDV